MIIESYKQGSINVKINANTSILIGKITVQKIHDIDKYRINNDKRIRTVLIKGVILITANKSNLE